VLSAAAAEGDWALVDSQVAEPPDPRIPRDFFAWCEEFVPRFDPGTRDLRCDEPTIARRLHDRADVADVGGIYNELKAQTDYEPDAVGICHPYAAPPVVRRVLPVLFEGQPVLPPPHPDYNAPPAHVRTGDGARLCALETPLAGCLDLMTRRDGRPAGDLLVLTGTSTQAELTGILLAGKGEHMVVTANVAWAISGGAGSRDFGDRLPAAISPALAGLRSPCRLVVYGSHLRGVAQAVVRAIGLSEGSVLHEEESSLAVGAARYAARCHARGLQGGGAEAGRLRVEHIVPRDVGVICSGRSGGAFWHRLFPGRAHLPVESAPIPVTGLLPTEVLLAERCDGSLRPCSWLEQGAWEPGALRWLASARVLGAEGGRMGKLLVRLANPSGRLDYGWSDLAVEASSCPP
jgi:hypothetical protein